MKIAVTTLLLLVAFTGCNFSKSVKKDLVSGLLTTGDGLSCDDVYISVNEKKTERSTFVYGEKFIVNFNGIEGFMKENDNVFPGMWMAVVSKTGDTVLQANDLYSDYLTGVNISPLLLSADITVATPMKSTGEYTVYMKISDKKGKGTFNAKLDFKVVANENIKTEANNVTFNEVYLFSKERGIVIPGNKIKFDENTYLILEGLSGFKEENGMVFPGLSLKGTDNSGKLVLDFDDLFAESGENGFAVADFNAQMASHFKMTAGEFNNPLHCEIILWDKKSDARIKASVNLILE